MVIRRHRDVCFPQNDSSLTSTQKRLKLKFFSLMNKRLRTIKKCVQMEQAKEENVNCGLCNFVAWAGGLIVFAVIAVSLYRTYLMPDDRW